MKRNLLAAVRANTSPMSSEEFEKFLVKRHGTLSKGNASADPSSLDLVGQDALESEKKTVVLIRYEIIKKATVKKRNLGVIMRVKRTNRSKKIAETIVSAGAGKKKMFGF